MIRLATLEDIPEMVELGRLFVSQTILQEIAPYHAESAEIFLKTVIEDDAGRAFVMESKGKVVGLITGMLVPLYWNNTILAAQQCAYFVHPDHRGPEAIKMLKVYEKSATECGVTLFFSGAKKGARFKGMDNMMQRQGYTELESVHVKGVQRCQQSL